MHLRQAICSDTPECRLILTARNSKYLKLRRIAYCSCKTCMRNAGKLLLSRYNCSPMPSQTMRLPTCWLHFGLSRQHVVGPCKQSVVLIPRAKNWTESLLSSLLNWRLCSLLFSLKSTFRILCRTQATNLPNGLLFSRVYYYILQQFFTLRVGLLRC